MLLLLSAFVNTRPFSFNDFQIVWTLSTCFLCFRLLFFLMIPENFDCIGLDIVFHFTNLITNRSHHIYTQIKSSIGNVFGGTIYFKPLFSKFNSFSDKTVDERLITKSSKNCSWSFNAGSGGRPLIFLNLSCCLIRVDVFLCSMTSRIRRSSSSHFS